MWTADGRGLPMPVMGLRSSGATVQAKKNLDEGFATGRGSKWAVIPVVVLSPLLAAFSGWAQAAPYPKDLIGGWSATLQIGGQGMPIEFELHDQGGILGGALLCGDERIPFSSIQLTDGEITLRLSQFGGWLRAKIERVQPPDSTEMLLTLSGDYTLPDGKGGKLRFWITAVHNAPVIQGEDPNDPEEAAKIWGVWQYDLADSSGNAIESGTLELTPKKDKRGLAWAKLTSAQRAGVILRGVGIKDPQWPTDEEIEAWEKSGKKPTKADLRTVEGVYFHRFDGQQALSFSADLQEDGSLLGLFQVNGAQLAFHATRRPR